MLVLLLVLQQSVADSSPFRPLALPPPTPTRGASGAPGPRYWQQRADYTLEATLDTAANVLRRMGRVGSRFYELGQWYPRMAVYDDVHGWNTLPFLGAGEFYLEFGDFDVNLTVPAGFTVMATGALANPSVVRSAQERARLAGAFTSPGQTVQVITRQEATANATRRVPGTKTWRFTASGVRDFAWAAGSGLRWDASTWDGILVQTFYHPEATPWEESNAMVRATLRHF